MTGREAGTHTNTHTHTYTHTDLSTKAGLTTDWGDKKLEKLPIRIIYLN